MGLCKARLNGVVVLDKFTCDENKENVVLLEQKQGEEHDAGKGTEEGEKLVCHS